MRNFHQDDRLSPSAQRRLDDYMADFADSILIEASRLNPNDVITARDIGDAYEATHARERKVRTAIDSGISGTTRTTFLPLLAGVTSLVVVGLLMTTLLPSGDLTAQDRGILLASALLAYVAAISSLSALLFTYMRSRRDRARAVRYAELGGRENDIAYYLAETLSSKAGKPDDLAHLTARFIPKWARLEDRLRRLAIVSLGMPPEIAEDYPIGALLSNLTRIGVLNKERGDDFAQILDVRNRLAHGGRASSAETQVGLDYMDMLEEFLDEQVSNHSVGGGHGSLA